MRRRAGLRVMGAVEPMGARVLSARIMWGRGCCGGRAGAQRVPTRIDADTACVPQPKGSAPGLGTARGAQPDVVAPLGYGRSQGQRLRRVSIDTASALARAQCWLSISAGDCGGRSARSRHPTGSDLRRPRGAGRRCRNRCAAGSHPAGRRCRRYRGCCPS